MALLFENSDYYLLDSTSALTVSGSLSSINAQEATTESLLETSEKNIIFYRDHFLGKPHYNFLARSTPKGPMAVSVVHNNGEFHCIIRTPSASEHLMVNANDVNQPWWRNLLGLSPSPYHVIQHSSIASGEFGLKPCSDPNLPADLLTFEEKLISKTYKFGVAYLREGQCTEADMMSNSPEQVSTAYTEFLSFLGDIIELKGWKAYRAGLDVQNGLTGTHSVYTKWKGFEFMFHVATFLPYVPTDPQQLERKRHIGNDIVVLVFQDHPTPFQLSTLTSKQFQVLVFVHPENDKYRVTVCAKQGVPHFGPTLPDPPLISKDPAGRDFLLQKLLFAERASYRSPSFFPKLQRTRQILLEEMINQYFPNA